MFIFCVLLLPSVLCYEQKCAGVGEAVRSLNCSTRDNSKDAYTTLLYHDDYLLQARVLGQGLLETGTTKDRVVLCTEVVSKESRDTLQADGWIIKPVSSIVTSPNKRKFGDSYSKLHAWNMTEYQKVVYLDLNDAVLVSNIDRLFDCGTFCASYQDFDVFYSGLMVIEPSFAVFRDMVRKAAVLTAYSGGEQSFLNEYFRDFLYAPLFSWNDSKRYHQHLRLPRELDEHVLINVHETKLWVWWHPRLRNGIHLMSSKWTGIRRRLQDHTHNSELIPSPLFWAPYPLIIALIIAARCLDQSLITRTAGMKKLQYFNEQFSHYLPLPFLCLSYFLSFNIVPTSMLPSQAEYVFWLWISFFLLLLMGSYCYLFQATSSKSCRMLNTKIMLTFALFVVFTISHSVVPVSFFIAIHATFSQISGDVIISIWTKA